MTILEGSQKTGEVGRLTVQKSFLAMTSNPPLHPTELDLSSDICEDTPLLSVILSLASKIMTPILQVTLQCFCVILESLQFH